jgi:5S rRNA maturation endonuclease (ribonuclease M5)
MGVQGRAIDKSEELRYSFYKYGSTYNMHAWLGEHTVNLDKPVVLVEGPFDYASVKRVYPNVLASFTCGIGYERVTRLKDASKIITLYDWGMGGNAARDAVKKYSKAPIIDIIPESAEVDAGDMKLEELKALLQEHVNLK